mmetsp:Transcript_23188/g.36262  ORF Transcript_23188/g.36262 Transcript_23188/m.36262 type:complete len:455 (+) Transcript_23188:98-1462(+)|eukprot:CAMPEP_0201739492 /NCGR_PEP_ID=MMETSP0593-20130828/45808_1 /ASSEMBLY_ACC=CAM_ASM_000672 /TAXON_ID=267983 /ORGANISM="Skeletonema japonicum, Strain CCMP2506" /LENGTH=454 /DNA_ID=CAMNT_0048233765 /DNA_START=83 /DNA_END=1447 /DNA_ORIENTATION=+
MNTIGKSDLDRIRCSSSIDDEDRNQERRKDHLKHLSDSRVAGWEDTLAAKRKARLEWKSEKAKREEKRQQALDAEEAKLQEKARIDRLQHADSLMMEQTEKVRNFRSQQLLEETLDERDKQMLLKEEERKKVTEEEKLWHRTVMNDIQNSEQKRKVDVARARQKSLELAKDLSLQKLERNRQLQLENHRRQEEEKNTIRQISKDNKAAEQAEIQLKLRRMEKAKSEMLQNEIILRQRRDDQIKEDQEETKRCEGELTRRIKMSVARAQLEEEHFQQKQAMRKVLSDRASHDLKQRAEREFEIFERDQQLKYQRDMKRAEEARKKQELARIEIDKSRKQQLQLKKQQLEADRQLNKLYMDERERITRQELVAEQQKEFAKRKENIECRKIQEQQAEENAKRRKEEEAERLRQEQEVLQKVEQEDDIFTQFALKEIERFKAKGKGGTNLLSKAINA